MTTNIDYKKEWKELYKPSAKAPKIVNVPAANYLMIDGAGNPNTAQRFQDAIQTLYPLAYALRFHIKKTFNISYTVMPLEGQYWGTPKEQTSFTDADKDKWSWTLMILQPEMITPALFEEKREEVRQKKNPPLIDEVRFESFTEGAVVQIMHLGSFDDEGPTVEGMHQYAYEQGYELCGKHHEIYLNDFRKVAPEKLKTILRHPVCKAA